MTAAVMLQGGAFTYHKHEQLVQAMAGVDLASTEEIGADKTPTPCRALIYCFLDTLLQ